MEAVSAAAGHGVGDRTEVSRGRSACRAARKSGESEISIDAACVELRVPVNCSTFEAGHDYASIV